MLRSRFDQKGQERGHGTLSSESRAGTSYLHSWLLLPLEPLECAFAGNRLLRPVVGSTLAPVSASEVSALPGPIACQTGKRCRDKGFPQMSEEADLELLDGTPRQIAAGYTGTNQRRSGKQKTFAYLPGWHSEFREYLVGRGNTIVADRSADRSAR